MPFVGSSLTEGEQYTDQGQEYIEERYRERVVHHLVKHAEQRGMRIVTQE